MRVRVLKPYDYTPSAERRVTIAYLPSEDLITVKREAGEAMVAAGAAEEVDAPKVGEGEFATASNVSVVSAKREAKAKAKAPDAGRG